MMVMQTNRRRTILKTILWGIVGVLIGVGVKGLLLGLGTTPQVLEAPPLWMKVTVALGVVIGAVLVFIFFAERRGASRHASQANPEDRLPADGRQSFDPVTMKLLLPDSLAGPRRNSLAALTATAIVIALLPQHILLGAQPDPTPVSAARTMEGPAIGGAPAADHDLVSTGGRDQLLHGSEALRIMIVDGNRQGEWALFPHDDHVSSVGGQNPCGFCHHQNLPFDRNSSCCECHRDMYRMTDIFSHSSHIGKLGGNDACTACHQNPNRIKTRNTAAPCMECHSDMLVEGSFVDPEEGGLKGYAVGYKEAMHGLCATCHEESDPDLADCAVCHRDKDGFPLHRMGPYVTRYGKR